MRIVEVLLDFKTSLFFFKLELQLGMTVLNPQFKFLAISRLSVDKFICVQCKDILGMRVAILVRKTDWGQQNKAATRPQLPNSVIEAIDPVALARSPDSSFISGSFN